MTPPFPISGYVLAGGRSSRMGSDKALINLGGKTLLEHAVTKLRRICGHVAVLSATRAHARFAPIVPDIHPNCGPLGGIEAALLQTAHAWNLFLPVDMPFVPTSLLIDRVSGLLHAPDSDPMRSPGIRLLIAGHGRQPALCLIHRDVCPVITDLILGQELALTAALEEVGRCLPFGSLALPLHSCGLLEENACPSAWQLTPSQDAARHLWFLNLNTPSSRRLAESYTAALDT